MSSYPFVKSQAILLIEWDFSSLDCWWIKRSDAEKKYAAHMFKLTDACYGRIFNWIRREQVSNACPLLHVLKKLLAICLRKVRENVAILLEAKDKQMSLRRLHKLWQGRSVINESQVNIQHRDYSHILIIDKCSIRIATSSAFIPDSPIPILCYKSSHGEWICATIFICTKHHTCANLGSIGMLPPHYP